jgi:hypothetical protein
MQGSQPLLEETSGGGKKHVRCHRADEDQVYIDRVDAGRLERASPRAFGQIRRGFTISGDSTLRDASSGNDPLIAGADDPFQICIAEDSIWNRGPCARNPLPYIVVPP